MSKDRNQEKNVTISHLYKKNKKGGIYIIDQQVKPRTKKEMFHCHTCMSKQKQGNMQ